MSKDKGGRETKKPKSDANKKVKGQTPRAGQRRARRDPPGRRQEVAAHLPGATPPPSLPADKRRRRQRRRVRSTVTPSDWEPWPR